MTIGKLKLDYPEWMPQDRPLLISGPCSAETEEQVLATAHGLKKAGNVDIFRAGIWKPRTRPNTFAGVGAIGLKWLQRVKKETGFLTAVEIANANHAYEALKHGIDVLWIGARTTVSPFAVQEIADALKGADVPVLVKNPINPDLQLWIGALERLNQAGITRLAAIHRGFSTTVTVPYRNEPKWRIPIELKRLIPEIPLICDPSHIAGKREFLEPVSQKALDLAMQGLMIETHPDPANALSDSAQQITPAELPKLIGSLTYRKPSGDSMAKANMLEVLRGEIDNLDQQLLEILARRCQISTRIGEYKNNNNMTIFQVRRWEKVMENRIDDATGLGLADKFINEIFQAIHHHSIELQEKVMNLAKNEKTVTPD